MEVVVVEAACLHKYMHVWRRCQQGVAVDGVMIDHCSALAGRYLNPTRCHIHTPSPIYTLYPLHVSARLVLHVGEHKLVEEATQR